MPTTHVLGTMVPLTQCGLTCLRRWKCNAAFSRDLAKARHERVSLNSRCRGSCCCYIDKMPLRSPFCLTNLYGCHFSFSLCSSRKSNALRLSSGECHIHLLTFDSQMNFSYANCIVCVALSYLISFSNLMVHNYRIWRHFVPDRVTRYIAQRTFEIVKCCVVVALHNNEYADDAEKKKPNSKKCESTILYVSFFCRRLHASNHSQHSKQIYDRIMMKI